MSTDLTNNNSMLLYLLNKIPYGVVVCDANYRVILWNNWAKKIFGNGEQKEVKEKDSTLYKAITTKQEITSKTIVNLGGEDVYMETEAAPLFDDHDKLIGGVAFIKDVSAMVKVSDLIDKAIDDVNRIKKYLEEYKNL